MHDIPQTTADLRNFGLVFGGLLIGFFGLLLPWIWDYQWPVWPWPVGLAFAGLAWIRPSLLRWPYLAWMRLGLALGWVNSRIILSLLFFVIVTPIGLVMRLLGKDPMHRKLQAGLNSYRVDSEIPADRHSLERPF